MKFLGGADGSSGGRSHPFGGILSKIGRLISNIVHRNLFAEKIFLENKEYLGTVLSHMKMDYDNPILREWCILCIRHLCEGNLNFYLM